MFRIMFYFTFLPFLPFAIGSQQIDRYDFRQLSSDYIHKFSAKAWTWESAFFSQWFFSSAIVILVPQYLLILVYRSSVRFFMIETYLISLIFQGLW